MKLFSYEAAHQRVDVARWAAYALALGVDAAWAYSAAVSVWNFALRAVVGGGVIILIRLALSRFGTTRLSASLGAITAFMLLSSLGLEQLFLIGVFVAYAIVLVEFSKLPSKQLALVVGLFTGLMAGILTDYGHMIALLLSVYLAVRCVWQVLFERGSKLQLILFLAKAGAMVGIAALTYGLLHAYKHDIVSGIALAPLPELPVWLAVVSGLLALRGVWSAVLLPTLRSPIARRQRILFACLGAVIAGGTWLCVQYASRVFAPGAVTFLSESGLLEWTVQGQIFGLLTLLLLATNGIDRSLFTTARLSELLVSSRRR